MSEGGSSASGLQLIMEGEITDWWWGGWVGIYYIQNIKDKRKILDASRGGKF